MKDRPVVGILVFLYIWLMVGFASGTGVLLGPARWVTTFARARGWTAGENVSMMVVMVLYVVASFFLARALARRLSLGRRVVRVAIPVGVTALAAVSFYGWTDPAMLARIAGGGIESELGTAGGANFVFGAYPDEAKLLELRRAGITRLISLQSPEVVPIEPRGIAAERDAARRLGMTFVNVPMLPWVSDNEQALQEIEAIADTATGRYYVHCGLGRDRANVVRSFLEHHGARVAATGDLKSANRLTERTSPFERGMPIQVDRDVWVVPYPNHAEMFGHFLSGQFRTVVSVLDPTHAEQAPLVDEAQTLLPEYNVDVYFYPIHEEDVADLETTAREAAMLVRAVPRPVAVFVPGAAPHPWNDSTVAVAFRHAYVELAGERPARSAAPVLAATRVAGTAARPVAPVVAMTGIAGAAARPATPVTVPASATLATGDAVAHGAARARIPAESATSRSAGASVPRSAAIAPRAARAHTASRRHARAAGAGHAAARRKAAVGSSAVTESSPNGGAKDNAVPHKQGRRSIFKRLLGHLPIHPVPLDQRK